LHPWTDPRPSRRSRNSPHAWIHAWKNDTENTAILRTLLATPAPPIIPSRLHNPWLPPAHLSPPYGPLLTPWMVPCPWNSTQPEPGALRHAKRNVTITWACATIVEERDTLYLSVLSGLLIGDPQRAGHLYPSSLKRRKKEAPRSDLGALPG